MARFWHTNEVELWEHGVALVRDVLQGDSLTRFRDAAGRCFDAIAGGKPTPEHYQFNRFSHSLLVTALSDFGGGSQDELLAPLSAPELDRLLSEALGGAWACRMEQSWVRQKFAPRHLPSRQYFPQGWHQDGALGVRFPTAPGPVTEMTQLATCWIALDPCGADSPGLEFVRRPQAALLHFTELDDAAIRRRFSPADFWAPVLAAGDGLVFLNGTLHRTYAVPEMPRNRLSVEYRVFPA